MLRPLRVKWQHSVKELEEAYKHEKDGKVKIRLFCDSSLGWFRLAQD